MTYDKYHLYKKPNNPGCILYPVDNPTHYLAKGWVTSGKVYRRCVDCGRFSLEGTHDTGCPTGNRDLLTAMLDKKATLLKDNGNSIKIRGTLYSTGMVDRYRLSWMTPTGPTDTGTHQQIKFNLDEIYEVDIDRDLIVLKP